MYTTTLRIVNYLLLEKEAKDALPPPPQPVKYAHTATQKKKLGKLISMRDHHVAVVSNAKDCAERCSTTPKNKRRGEGNTFGNNYSTRWG